MIIYSTGYDRGEFKSKSKFEELMLVYPGDAKLENLN
jgi:hypothetical protein